MFLTRLGFGSKIVVTGDITQVDLPGGTRSGLRVVREILDGVEDVHFAQLTSADVVRHRLVSDIVDAYERWDAVQEQQQAQTIRAVPGPGRHTPAALPAAAPGGASLTPGDARQCPSRSPTSPVPTSTPTPSSTVARLRARRDGGQPARRAVRAAGRRRLHGRAEPPLDGRRRPDRRARLPDGGGHDRPGPERDRRRRADAARRRRALPGGGRRSRRSRPATRPPTSCTCSPCTGCCTCSATTTPSRTRSGRCSRCRPSCSTAGAARAKQVAGMNDATLILDRRRSGRPGRLLRRCPTRPSPPCPGPAPASWPGRRLRGARALQTIAADPARYTNLLLLLRLVCELTATTLVALVVIGAIDTSWLAALVTAGTMTVVSFVVVGVGPRTIGRQHAYSVGRFAAPLVLWLGRALGPLADAADPDRQRVHPRQGLPGGPVRDPGRAARAGRPGRAARRGRARRARHDPLGLRARRHHRPRGDGAADRDGVDRGAQVGQPGARRWRCAPASPGCR